jgi:uncharacterized protein (DUF58 family)
MNAWRWLLTLALVLLIAGLTKAWLAAWLFYCLAAILLLALAVAWRPAKLRQTRRRPNATHVEIDQEVVVDITLAWERPVGAGWVLARDEVDPELTLISPPGRLFIGSSSNRTSYAYRVAPAKRGYFPLGPLSVSCGDLFGIARAESTEADIAYLTAYPKVLSVPPVRLPSNRPLGDMRASRQLQEDAARLVGVRDYRPGDSLAKIHWKATARSGALTSKIFEPSSAIEVAVVLNMSADDYPEDGREIELACTTAASVITALLLERDTVSLQSNGADAAIRHDRSLLGALEVKAERGTAQLPVFLSTLARLEPSRERLLPGYLTEIHSRLPWSSTLLLITHRLSEEAAAALEALKRSGFALALIVVGAGNEARAAMTRAASLDIYSAWVKTEEQLGVLEFWRAR